MTRLLRRTSSRAAIAAAVVLCSALTLLSGPAWAKGAPPAKPPPAPVKPAAPLAWVSGTVSDEEGKPVAGAEAIVLQVEPKGKWKTTTDAKGMYAAKGVPAGEATVFVRAKSRIPVEQKVMVPDKGVVTADAVLKLGVRFSGKVTDGRGGPIAGARIDPVLVDVRDNEVQTQIPAFLRGTFASGADGTFVVDGLEPGNRYKLGFKHPHFLENLMTGLNAEAGGGHDDLDWSMEDAAWILGTVVDPAGKPVAGAVVGEPEADEGPDTAGMNEFLRELLSAFNEDGGPTPGGPVAATTLGNVTDAQGRFEVGGLKDGEYEVAVTSDAYFTTKWKVEELVAGKAKTDVKITLEPATAFLAGTVVDAAGAPVAGATVTAYGDVRLAAEGKTDARGAFRLNRVRSHLPVELRAKAEAFAEATVKDVVLNQQGVKVVLQPLPRLKVKVVDEDGKAIPRVTIVQAGRGKVIKFQGGSIRIGMPDRKKEWDQPEAGLDVPIPLGDVEIRVTAKGFTEEPVGKWTTEAGKTIDGGTITLKRS